jgi:hypothetical protein
MTTDTILMKRRARYPGEVGFFPDNEMSQEDIAQATINEEVIVTWYRPRTLERLRYLWGLVYKIWQNTDRWMDHHEAMEELKERAHFTRMRWDSKEKMLKPRVKSLKRINDNELRLLTERIIDVICQEILPGIERDDLRREVEEMFKDRVA